MIRIEKPPMINATLVERCFDPGALIILAMTSSLFLVHTMEFALDDSYITYRYAKHLELGYGLVFNVGERYLGTTAPGFAILLALLHRTVDVLHLVDALALVSGVSPDRIALLLDLPHLARYVSAASIGVVGMVSYRFVACAFPDIFGRIAGLLGAVWIMTARSLASVTGHETLTCIALVLLGLHFWRTRRALASLTLGLAVVVRPDAALAFAIPAGLTGMAWLREGRRANLRREVQLLLPFLGPVLAWTLFAWAYYGSPLPGTLFAKRAQVVLGIWPVTSFSQMADSVVDAVPALVRWPVLFCAVVGAVSALLRKDSFRFVALWGASHLIAFSVLGVTFWPWYATPLQVVYMLCGTYGVASIGTALWAMRGRSEATPARRRGRRAGRTGRDGRRPPGEATRRGSSDLLTVLWVPPLAVVLLGMMVLAIEPGWNATLGQQLVHRHTLSFLEVADYIRRHSPEGASLATPEPGAIAYFLGPKYRVIDSMGLVGPGVSQHIIEGDFEWLYLHYKPDYVLVSYEGEIQPNLHKPWFQHMYSQVAGFDHPYWTDQNITLRLFRRRDETFPTPAKMTFNDVPPRRDWPAYAQIPPGRNYTTRLELAAATPRVLRVTFLDLKGRDLDIYADDMLLQRIVAGASGGRWVTIDVAVPAEIGSQFRLRFHNPGRDISAVSEAEVVYAREGAAHDWPRSAGWPWRA